MAQEFTSRMVRRLAGGGGGDGGRQSEVCSVRRFWYEISGRYLT